MDTVADLLLLLCTTRPAEYECLLLPGLLVELLDRLLHCWDLAAVVAADWDDELLGLESAMREFSDCEGRTDTEVIRHWVSRTAAALTDTDLRAAVGRGRLLVTVVADFAAAVGICWVDADLVGTLLS